MHPRPRPTPYGPDSVPIEQPASRRTRRGRVVTSLVVTVTVLELAVRAGAAHLPQPQRWSTPETQFKVNQIDTRGRADLAIVGSSIVDVGLDPSVLGANAYNAALGAASIGMAADFTRAVVIPHLDPKVVVVGISSRELNANAPGQAGIEQQFRASPGAKQALGTETRLDRADRLLSEVSYLARYRSILREPTSWFGDAKASWDGTITRSDGLYLGFLNEPYHGDAAVLTKLRNGSVHDFALGAAQKGVLRRLLVDLRAQGRRVILVSVPVTQDYVDLYPRGLADHQTYVEAVRSLAADVGVEFVDAGIWDRSLMADPLHSNRAGNQRLSALVAARLG